MTEHVIEIDGQKAVVSYDPETNTFRGEFIGLNGGADFYATDIAGLLKQGRASLAAFLQTCREENIERAA